MSSAHRPHPPLSSSVPGVSGCLHVLLVSPCVSGCSRCSRCLWVPQVSPAVTGVSRCFQVFQASWSSPGGALSFSFLSWENSFFPTTVRYCSCSTSSCFTLKVRDKQNHIICKEQRSKTEAPDPETLLASAAPPDPGKPQPRSKTEGGLGDSHTHRGNARPNACA